MDWQDAIALMIVAFTAGIFLWKRLQKRAIQSNCQGGCGCPKTTQPQSVIYRARKGHKPEIIIKPNH